MLLCYALWECLSGRFINFYYYHKFFTLKISLSLQNSGFKHDISLNEALFWKLFENKNKRKIIEIWVNLVIVAFCIFQIVSLFCRRKLLLEAKLSQYSYVDGLKFRICSLKLTGTCKESTLFSSVWQLWDFKRSNPISKHLQWVISFSRTVSWIKTREGLEPCRGI